VFSSDCLWGEGGVIFGGTAAYSYNGRVCGFGLGLETEVVKTRTGWGRCLVGQEREPPLLDHQ
jgi:hypothetical protein